MSNQNQQVVFRHTGTSPLGRVSQAGFLRNSRGLTQMRLYDRYALVYLLNGSGRYRDASGRDRAVAAGDVIVVFPGVPHQYGPGPGEFWDEFFLCFDGPVIELWRRHAILDPKNPIYHLEPVHEWLRRFESILGASRHPGSIPPLDEMCRLQQLLADMVLGCNQNPVYQADRNWASRTCALLGAEHDLPDDLAGFARSLGMSYESFRKRFTRVVGQPPAKYRTARLIDRACELMQQGRMSDKQIALSLGFCDEFYFSRRFKQVIGQSPRQFRQRFTAYGYHRPNVARLGAGGDGISRPRQGRLF